MYYIIYFPKILYNILIIYTYIIYIIFQFTDKSPVVLNKNKVDVKMWTWFK